MASWIVLDWVNDQFHVLCAQSSRRGVQVNRALTWTHPEPLTLSTAERAGKAFREFLKTEKIASASVIVGLGRDRVFLKELRFPPIEAHEEANLVRFQTAKEMAEAVDNYAIDYVPINDGSGSERKVMAVAGRRDIMQSLQTLCLAAGLKLHAVTPRLFGMAHALTRSAAPERKPLGSNQLSAVLAVGKRWAELTFFRGDRLLQAQAIANGPMLANELKRNLAVFQAHYAANIDLNGPDQLFLFCDDASLAETIGGAVGIPVQSLNPLWPEPDLAEALEAPARFAGAVGLAMLWSESGAKAINLAAPRRTQAPVSASRIRIMLVGAVFASILLLAIGALSWLLIRERSENQKLTKAKIDSEEFLKTVAQERADIDAVKEWEATSVPWLDEIYDLSARFPFESGFRVNQFSATPTTVKRGGKETAIARVTINGIVPSEKHERDGLLSRLLDATASDPHVKLSLERTKSGETVTEFFLKLDVSKQDLKKYETVLSVPVMPPPRIIEVIKKVPAKTAEPEEKKSDADEKMSQEGGDQ